MRVYNKTSMKKWSDKNIIFIFSLPRTGSTLVQRLLTAHPQIFSAAETWLLLPLFYAVRSQSVFAEYIHIDASTAINEFCKQLPGGYSDYLDEVRNFSVSLFSKISCKHEQATHFVEKSPRNVLIIDEIIQAFPNSKFIFLWRNPLAIISSLIETFGDGKWNLYKYKIDLFQGLENMASSYKSNSAQIYSLKYEDLIINPEQTCKQIFDFLQIPFNESILSKFSAVKLEGRMGDPTGTIDYSEINSAPLSKWMKIINNPIRRGWAKKYLDWIGHERLNVMGYEKNFLIGELHSTQPNFKNFFSDMLRIFYGFLDNYFELKVFNSKLKKYKGNRYVVRHY